MSHLPWCCKHRWTLRYIAVVATSSLVLELLQTYGVL